MEDTRIFATLRDMPIGDGRMHSILGTNATIEGAPVTLPTLNPATTLGLQRSFYNQLARIPAALSPHSATIAGVLGTVTTVGWFYGGEQERSQSNIQHAVASILRIIQTDEFYGRDVTNQNGWPRILDLMAEEVRRAIGAHHLSYIEGLAVMERLEYQLESGSLAHNYIASRERLHTRRKKSGQGPERRTDKAEQNRAESQAQDHSSSDSNGSPPKKKKRGNRGDPKPSEFDKDESDDDDSDPKPDGGAGRAVNVPRKQQNNNVVSKSGRNSILKTKNTGSEKEGTDRKRKRDSEAGSPHAESPHAESPHAESPHAESPHAESPHAESPHAGSPHAGYQLPRSSPSPKRPGTPFPVASPPTARPITPERSPRRGSSLTRSSLYSAERKTPRRNWTCRVCEELIDITEWEAHRTSETHKFNKKLIEEAEANREPSKSKPYPGFRDNSTGDNYFVNCTFCGTLLKRVFWEDHVQSEHLVSYPTLPDLSSPRPTRLRLDAFGNPIGPLRTNTPAPPRRTSATPMPPSSQQLEQMREEPETPVAEWKVTEEVEGVEITTPYVGTVEITMGADGAQTVTLTPVRTGNPVLSPTSPSLSQSPRRPRKLPAIEEALEPEDVPSSTTGSAPINAPTTGNSLMSELGLSSGVGNLDQEAAQRWSNEDSEDNTGNEIEDDSQDEDSDENLSGELPSNRRTNRGKGVPDLESEEEGEDEEDEDEEDSNEDDDEEDSSEDDDDEEGDDNSSEDDADYGEGPPGAGNAPTARKSGSDNSTRRYPTTPSRSTSSPFPPRKTGPHMPFNRRHHPQVVIPVVRPSSTTTTPSFRPYTGVDKDRGPPPDVAEKFPEFKETPPKSNAATPQTPPLKGTPPPRTPKGIYRKWRHNWPTYVGEDRAPSNGMDLTDIDDEELDEHVSKRKISPGEREWTPVLPGKRTSVLDRDISPTPSRRLPGRSAKYRGSYTERDRSLTRAEEGSKRFEGTRHRY